jgi:hypothetical protein
VDVNVGHGVVVGVYIFVPIRIVGASILLLAHADHGPFVLHLDVFEFAELHILNIGLLFHHLVSLLGFYFDGFLLNDH